MRDVKYMHCKKAVAGNNTHTPTPSTYKQPQCPCDWAGRNHLIFAIILAGGLRWEEASRHRWHLWVSLQPQVNIHATDM